MEKKQGMTIGVFIALLVAIFVATGVIA